MITETQIDTIVEELFATLEFPQFPSGLYDPLRYMIQLGGKRIRPRLCLTTFSLFKDDFTETVLFPAAALEVFHSFTLIHDDMMDKADIRRGRPTVYVKWGDNTGILSGDVMCIESYRLLSHSPKESLPEVLSLFTGTAAKVCQGQQYDMEFETREDVTMQEYIKMIGLKTAVLIACSAKMGALVAGAGKTECDACYSYGYDLGVAFQIADDYLDTFGDTKVFGKAIGGDILNNKKTWLLIKAFEKADDTVKSELAAAMQLPSETKEEKQKKIETVKSIYVKLGVDEDAKYEILKYHSSAMSHVEPLELSKFKFEMLRRYADKLVGRTS